MLRTRPMPDDTPAPIDRASPLPLWAQVLADLRARLAGGEFAERFPTDHALVARYGVSRQTVREATRRLAAEGLIERERGRGTRVRGFEQAAGTLEGLSEHVRALGVDQRNEVRRREIVHDADVARRLGLAPRAALAHIELLRLADGSPLALDRMWLPASLARPLLERDLSRSGVYAELASACGVAVTDAVERLTPVVPAAGERRALRLPAGQAAFRIERTTSAGAVLVEYRLSLVRGDRYAVIVKSLRSGAGVEWGAVA
jgi:GntR family transcriptional regulator